MSDGTHSEPAPPVDGLTDLAKKIAARQLKRKAAETSTPLPVPTVVAVAPVAAEWQPAAGESPAEREKREKKEKRAKIMAEVVPEWRPAAGESPAEREKREKREKRAGRTGVTFDTNPAPPSGSTYVPPPPVNNEYSLPDQSAQFDQSQSYDQSYGSSNNSIHPSRMAAAPALAREVREKDPNKEKTTSKKRYLKRKKERSKGKKAGEPAAPGRPAKKVKLADGGAAVGEGEDESDESEDEDEEREKEEKRKEKVKLILQKKADRKVKRDEVKAEARRVRAEGGVPVAAVPRVVPSKASPVVAADDVVMDGPPAEPTAAQLELAVIEAARVARKATKREKRTARRLPSPPPAPSALPVPTEASVPDEPRSRTPEVDIDPIPQPEPAPLIRLPGATRPAPPSAKTLSALKVHESVRNKMVVDPELRVGLGQGGLELSERAIKRLGEMGVETAFAVQTAVLPLLLPASSPTYLYAPFAPPRDVCVSAPTGSGKTLSYVVPIVETLKDRVVTRLRALILLPTRDLVTQVRETFEAFGKGTGLKIGTATGQHSFAHEQVSLIGELDSSAPAGGAVMVDILIATPGRLMDHIRSTPGFSLQHLRYLVIDEADRLLNQSFHDWLPSILSALKPTPPTASTGQSIDELPLADALAPEWWDAQIGRVPSSFDERCLPSTQKLLFSATLSRDPAKIAALHLHRPIYVSVEDAMDPNAADQEVDEELKFTLPATLTEHMIVSPSTHKPLYLLHLLHTLKLSSALCFTKSVEAATRLAKLVDFFEDARLAAEPTAQRVVVSAYSSDLPPSERTRIFNSFKRGEIQMLIASDLISRGVDLPSVSHVISYDIPSDMRKYVHRVGRTARAGKEGEAWSLVEDQEAAAFKGIMKGAQHWEKIGRVRVKDTLVEGFVPSYQIALDRLSAHLGSKNRE